MTDPHEGVSMSQSRQRFTAILFLTVCMAARSLASDARQLSCDKAECSNVRVEGNSKGTESNVYGARSAAATDAMTLNVRVSGSHNTYQLTCNREDNNCKPPVLGKEYQMVVVEGDKPQELNDTEGEYPHRGKIIYLRTDNVILGPYWMVAVLPLIPPNMFQKLMSECSSKEEGLNEDDCARWLARRARMNEMGCPDSDAEVACQSFHELLRVADPDLMDVFARLEHVYVCFHPNEDEFFDVWFSEPVEWDWRKADENEQRFFHLQAGTLVQMGAPGAYYFDKGVNDENAAITDPVMGVWSYLPLGGDVEPATLARLATSNDARFRGKVFQIDGTRLEANEDYKNKNGEEIHHRLMIQRSTGRFSETYAKMPNERTFLTYSGSCLVAPNGAD
jgi:hypothetical protein